MICSYCDIYFCYKCGEKYVEVMFIGNYYERFSFFGCKYNLYLDKFVLRKMIRGLAFGIYKYIDYILFYIKIFMDNDLCLN